MFEKLKSAAWVLAGVAGLGLAFAGCKKADGNSNSGGGKEVKLLNVSYDPTRELYEEYNKAFTKYYEGKTGTKVNVQQSHGGSGKQAKAVVEGVQADVVTLALGYDIDTLHDNGNLIPTDWATRLPNNSSPYTSTIVLLVRKGNPKGIKDWEDLLKEGVEISVANPKTSGGARWAYLAAWGHALRKNSGDEAKAKEFIAELYKHAPVLGPGARDATVNFTDKAIGDVLVGWENEAFLVLKDAPDKYEIVVPTDSVLAEPPVSVVDKVADKHGTRAIAEEYLKYLYSPEGQEIAARNYYRPRLAEVAAKYKDKFPTIQLFELKDIGGEWKAVHAKHFANGGIFDQVKGK